MVPPAGSSRWRPRQVVAAGDILSPVVAVQQHVLHRTSEQVKPGLAGIMG